MAPKTPKASAIRYQGRQFRFAAALASSVAAASEAAFAAGASFHTEPFYS
jgi:hypothetical protein